VSSDQEIMIKENHPSLAKHNEVGNIVSPLKELLGLNYFCFRRIYYDGRHIALTANPEWLVTYYENKYYLKPETRSLGTVGTFQPVVWDHIEEKAKFSDTAMLMLRIKALITHSL